MPVKFTKNWGKLKTWFRRMKAGVFADEFERDLQALANAITVKAVGHIKNQDLGWVGLAEGTVDRKGHAQVYLETGEYMSSINAKLTRKGRFSFEMFVGPEGGHSSGLSMQTLAGFLEFGTSKMPARPLWRPTFAEVQRLPEFQQILRLEPKFSFGRV